MGSTNKLRGHHYNLRGSHRYFWGLSNDLKIFARHFEFTRNTYPNGPPYISGFASIFIDVAPVSIR